MMKRLFTVLALLVVVATVPAGAGEIYITGDFVRSVVTAPLDVSAAGTVNLDVIDSEVAGICTAVASLTTLTSPSSYNLTMNIQGGVTSGALVNVGAASTALTAVGSQSLSSLVGLRYVRISYTVTGSAAAATATFYLSCKR